MNEIRNECVEGGNSSRSSFLVDCREDSFYGMMIAPPGVKTTVTSLSGSMVVVVIDMDDLSEDLVTIWRRNSVVIPDDHLFGFFSANGGRGCLAMMSFDSVIDPSGIRFVCVDDLNRIGVMKGFFVNHSVFNSDVKTLDRIKEALNGQL